MEPSAPKPAVKLLVLLILQTLSPPSLSIQCPSPCSCPLDGRGRRQVICMKGGLVDPLPVLEMPHDAEVLNINAPVRKLNELTLGPIFKGHRRLEEIHVARSQIPALGAHSFWGLRRLHVLNLTQNAVLALMDTNFRGAESLRQLDLSHNKIESVPSAVFRHVRLLRTLNLAHNRIPELVPRIFFGLSKLERLDVSYNPLGDIPADRFKDTPNIRVLKCAGCGLMTVPKVLMEALPNLHQLDLRDNRLSEVPSVTLLPHLITLHLDGNHISMLSRAFLSGLPLTTLTMSHNKLIRIESRALSNCSLRHLDIAYNRLSHLEPGALDDALDQLHVLKLSGNSLHIDQLMLVLPKAVELRFLGIGDMGLTRLHPSLLRHARHLQHLNVSANYLSRFPNEMLYSTPMLQSLNLALNSFRGLDDDLVTAFRSMAALESVRLEGNPWQCDRCHVEALIEWINGEPTHVHAAHVCGNHPPDARCLKCIGPQEMAGLEMPLLSPRELRSCDIQPQAPWPTWLAKPASPESHESLKTQSDDPRMPRGHLLKESTVYHEGQWTMRSFFTDNMYWLIAGACVVVMLILTIIIVAIVLSRRHSAFYYTYEDDDAEKSQKLMGRNNNDSPVANKATTATSAGAGAGAEAKGAKSRTPRGPAAIATIEEVTSIGGSVTEIEPHG